MVVTISLGRLFVTDRMWTQIGIHDNILYKYIYIFVRE